MPRRMHRNDICCGALDLTLGIWLIGIDSLIHGLYGVGIYYTTYHDSKNNGINITFQLGCYLFVVLGTFKVLGYVTIFVAVYVFSVGVVYLHKYDKLLASSLLDRTFFVKKGRSLVEKDYAFTWWHVLTGYYVVLTPIWFYYAYVMCRFPKTIRPRSMCHRSAMKKQLLNASVSVASIATTQRKQDEKKKEDTEV